MAATPASATLQSYLVNPGARAGSFKGYAPIACSSVPCKRNMRVNCQAEEATTPYEQPTSALLAPAPQSPPPKSKMMISYELLTTNFSDVMAISGPGPERIACRSAMIGFVSAMGVELATGSGLAQQLTNGGLSWFLVTIAVVAIGTLTPLVQGITVESRSEELFSADTEKLNGMAAMMGLVALAFTEYVRGGALV